MRQGGGNERERERDAGAVMNADRRQRGLSYFNTPAPLFVSAADLAVRPQSLIIWPGGPQLLNKDMILPEHTQTHTLPHTYTHTDSHPPTHTHIHTQQNIH